MALQNRVSVEGELVTTNARGTLMGNRGIIHDAGSKSLLTRRWQHQAWVCCRLEWKGFQHPIMGTGAYTELFFLDEATALAAGHRPCAFCRRADFNAFKSAWIEANCAAHTGFLPMPAIDKRLHQDRVTRKRQQITYIDSLKRLPDGVVVRWCRQNCLVLGKHLYPWSFFGYDKPFKRPIDDVCVLTPRSSVNAITAGYQVALHPSLV